MTTLSELAAAILPAARWAGPPGAPDAPTLPIAWVRVMRARVPAFDALEPGDLAIVPASALTVVAPGIEELQALAAACSAARVSGVLLVEGETGDTSAGPDSLDVTTLLDGLVAALTERSVPALRVPRAETAELERSLIGYLVTQGAELDRQAALLETRLERLALEGGGTAALVGAMATFLGRAVALEGRRGDPLAVHAPPDVPDGAAAVARYHARPRHAVALRVPLPTAGGAAGGLVLLGERPVGELERVSIARVAGLLALELSRDEAVRRAQDEARRAEALPSAGPPWVVLIARQRTPGGEDDAPEARERRESVRRELRMLAPARRLALRGDADSLEIRAVMALDGDSATTEGVLMAGRMATFLGRTVAVSRPFTAPTERPAQEAEARAALQAAEVLAHPPQVAQVSRLAAYRLLGALHNLPEGDRLARELLEPLLNSRPDVRREHLATLRALLDHGGASEAAAALGVHRNTVSYRLRRIEVLTGWRLADPEVRLPLAIALRLVQTDYL
ncbi:MAG: helix-turn-helix domain-containing protein [Chloroflexota bacterium]